MDISYENNSERGPMNIPRREFDISRAVHEKLKGEDVLRKEMMAAKAHRISREDQGGDVQRTTITGQLDILGEQLGKLGALIETLEECLFPVMRPEFDEPNNTSSDNSATALRTDCLLSELVDSRIAMVRRLQNEIVTINHRVQI